MKLRVFSIILIVILGVSLTAAVLLNEKARENEYSSYLASARKFANNKVPYTSVERYKSALHVKSNDEEVFREYLEQAALLGGDFYSEAVKEYAAACPDSPQANEALCTYYYNNEDYGKLLEAAISAKDKGAATELIRDYYLEIYYSYRYIRTDLEEAQTFLGNCAVIKKNGLYGYLMDDGSYLVAPVFLDAAPMLGTTTAVRDVEEWYMMNRGGYKVARTTVPVDQLSFASGGKILVGKGGKYGFTDMSLSVPEDLPYDEASNYKNGVAAVRQGNKWALIDMEENNITDFVFDTVKLDEYGACVDNGVIFAAIAGKYHMYDTLGKQIGESSFDDVCPFYSDEPAAVRIGNAWGFVDATGDIVVQPRYADAGSYSEGLAPVREEGTWGYINREGEYRIESMFDDAKPISEGGIAAVCESGVWSYIKLLAYYY